SDSAVVSMSKTPRCRGTDRRSVSDRAGVNHSMTVDARPLMSIGLNHAARNIPRAYDPLRDQLPDDLAPRRRESRRDRRSGRGADRHGVVLAATARRGALVEGGGAALVCG